MGGAYKDEAARLLDRGSLLRSLIESCVTGVWHSSSEIMDSVSQGFPRFSRFPKTISTLLDMLISIWDWFKMYQNTTNLEKYRWRNHISRDVEKRIVRFVTL